MMVMVVNRQQEMASIQQPPLSLCYMYGVVYTIKCISYSAVLSCKMTDERGLVGRTRHGSIFERGSIWKSHVCLDLLNESSLLKPHTLTHELEDELTMSSSSPSVDCLGPKNKKNANHTDNPESLWPQNVNGC